MFIFHISCLVYCKRGTGSFILDFMHTSLGCPMMSAEGRRHIFIINVCLSCLPSCLYLHYCEELERPKLSRIECLPSPGASLLRKVIINSPCQIRREHQGRKCYYSRGCSGMPLIPSMLRIHFKNFNDHRFEKISNML